EVRMIPSPQGGTDFQVKKTIAEPKKDTGTNGDTTVAAHATEVIPQEQKITAGLPEGFVLYEGSKEQFTIAIPKDWTAFDQGQMLSAQGVKSGNFNLVYFLPAEHSKAMSIEVIQKMDRGEVPSFFVQKLPAGQGMSCTALSDKAQK